MGATDNTLNLYDAICNNRFRRLPDSLMLSELSQLQRLRFGGAQSLQKGHRQWSAQPCKKREEEKSMIAQVLQLLTRNYSIVSVCYKSELKHMDVAETGLKKDYG